jgi:hypothetical protein
VTGCGVQVVFHSAKCEAPFGGTGLLATRRVSRSPVTSAAPGQPAIQSPPSWSAKPNTRCAPPLSTGRLARRVGAALPIVGERKSDRQSPPTYAIGEPLSGCFAIACLRTCCVPPTRHELRREHTRRQRVGCQNSDRRLRMGRFTGGMEFWHPHKVRGALLVACAQAGVPCAEYPPASRPCARGVQKLDACPEKSAICRQDGNFGTTTGAAGRSRVMGRGVSWESTPGSACTSSLDPGVEVLALHSYVRLI